MVVPCGVAPPLRPRRRGGPPPPPSAVPCRIQPCRIFGTAGPGAGVRCRLSAFDSHRRRPAQLLALKTPCHYHGECEVVGTWCWMEFGPWLPGSRIAAAAGPGPTDLYPSPEGRVWGRTTRWRRCTWTPMMTIGYYLIWLMPWRLFAVLFPQAGAGVRSPAPGVGGAAALPGPVEGWKR